MSLGTRTFFLTHNSQLIEAKANGKCSSVEMLIARNIDVRITWKSNFATCVYLSIFNKKYRELRIWHFHSAYDAAGVSGNSSFPGISASIFPSLPIGKFHSPSDGAHKTVRICVTGTSDWRENRPRKNGLSMISSWKTTDGVVRPIFMEDFYWQFKCYLPDWYLLYKCVCLQIGFEIFLLCCK